MARVYSTQLASVVSLGAGPTEVGLVPIGSVWVVRHMTAYFANVVSAPLDGFQVHTGAGLYVWVVGPLGVSCALPYDWSGRHVFNAGEALYFDSVDDANWQLLISGYELELP